MRKYTIVICANGLEIVREELQTRLPQWEIVSAEGSALLEAARRATVLIPARGIVSRDVIDRAEKCRLVQQYGAGVDGVDQVAATEREIPVCRVPTSQSGSAEAIAQLVVFHLVALSRDYPRRVAQAGGQPLQSWVSHDLSGATIGILGYGDVGKATARLLSGWNVDVVATKRDPSFQGERPGHVRWIGGSWRLMDLLRESDYVVSCLPLSAETERLIGAPEFDAMREGGHLVNVGRAEVVDRDAALRALSTGRIASMGLDVFWEEPPDADDPLLGEATLYTPHIGGLTHQVLAATSDIVADNCRRVVQGHEPQHQVN